MLDGGWLFPGFDPLESLSTRQLNRAIHTAARAAGIDKRVSMHTLRHYSEFQTMPTVITRTLESVLTVVIPGRMHVDNSA